MSEDRNFNKIKGHTKGEILYMDLYIKNDLICKANFENCESSAQPSILSVDSVSLSVE